MNESDQAILGLLMGSFIIPLVCMAVLAASAWKVHVKAGYPGWTALVPIYNFVVVYKIARVPLWQALLLVIPFVNIYALWNLNYGFAKCFGKGAGFAVGLMVLGFIFYPILAFGDAVYVGAPTPRPSQGLPKAA